MSVEAAQELDLALGRAVLLNRAEKPNSSLANLETLHLGNHIQSDVDVVIADFVAELRLCFTHLDPITLCQTHSV